MYSQLNESMKQSRSLLRALRVQNRRCARQDPPTPRLQRRHSLPDLSIEMATPRGVSTPRVAATPRGVRPTEVSTQRSTCPESEISSLVELAVGVVTQVRTEVDSLISVLDKLDKVWNVSEERLAVEHRRAQSLKQMRLKRALKN